MKDAGGGVSTLRDSLAAAMVGGELSERHCEILEAAAGLFAERGYAATSVRDIGEKVGLLGGSLYHYIKSKEALFVRIHDMALQVAGDRIATAMAGKTDPWERLEAACVTMLEIQLDPHSLTMPLMNDFASAPPEIRERLVAKRDAFEAIFRELIPVAARPGARPRRLLSAAADIAQQCQQLVPPGRHEPEDIGRQIVRIFRHDVKEKRA
jgi:AcrR family transcriptional regulator